MIKTNRKTGKRNERARAIKRKSSEVVEQTREQAQMSENKNKNKKQKKQKIKQK